MSRMGERLIFGTSVEGMLRALGDDLKRPDVKQSLLAIGINPDKLLPAYRIPEYLGLMDFIGAQRFPTLGSEERDRALGREFIRGFSETFVGKATLAMGRVIGPRRGTKRLTRSMRAVNNYSTSGIITEAETQVDVWIEPVLRPWYYVGVFEAGGQVLYGESYQAELLSFAKESERAEFRIRWA